MSREIEPPSSSLWQRPRRSLPDTAPNLRSTTQRALSAASEGDLEALAAALAEREIAIRESAAANASLSDPPYAEHAVVQTAFEQASVEQLAAVRDGEAIRELLADLRDRVESERDLLARFSSGLVNSVPVPRASIDLFG